ncbi:MAG: DUF4382 domain-containing protein [Woeseiaceae bacterium]|nr:DUF4382 domain-containing protein [Woeseiaceae bacterium]
MKRSLIAGSVAMVLAGCGGSSFNEVFEDTSTGSLSIAITDAPVDNVTEVWVEFSGVTLKPQGGDEIEIAFSSPKSFDLLTLQNGVTAVLQESTTVPAGPYNWVRLGVNAEPGVRDSYAVQNGMELELRIPSGSERGLQLSGGLTVTANQSSSFVVDWDLRQALVDPVGQPGVLLLRPSLRITDQTRSGTLTGTVDTALLDATATGCANDLAADTGNAVYLFDGATSNVNDINDTDTDPVVTANVTQDQDGNYVYSISYLEVGEYTAAFTCTASNDDPAEDDNADDAVDPFDFAAVVNNITIVERETTVVDFAVPE